MARKIKSDTEIMLVIYHPRNGVVSTTIHPTKDVAELEGKFACEDCPELWYAISEPGCVVR